MAENQEKEGRKERAGRQERHAGSSRGKERQASPRENSPAEERERRERFHQGREAEAREVIKAAQSLERTRRQTRALNEELSRAVDRGANKGEIAGINRQINVEADNARRCRAALEGYLGFETEIKGFDDLGALISSGEKKGDDLESLKILRDTWINAEVARIRPNRGEILGKIDLLAQRRRDAIRERLGLMKQNPLYSYQVAAQVLGDPSYNNEVYELIKNLPEEEARFLMAYSQSEIERSSAFAEMQKTLSLDWGEKSEDEQKVYIKQRIIAIRNSQVDPSMIINSPAWIDLVQKMNDERTSFEVKDMFNNHFKLLQYYVSGRNLADAIIDPRDFTARLEALSSGVIGGLFREKEIQVAYDTLVRNSKNVMRINTEGSLWAAIKGEYEDEYLEQIGIGKTKATEDQKNEARAALAEAFDLFYVFNSLQDVEGSAMKPDNIRKALSLSGWMRGKFAPELVEAFHKLRFYREKDKDGRPIPIKTSKDYHNESEFQRVNAGVNKPFHALFAALKLEDFERMGFTVSQNKETIYDYQDRQCFSFYKKDSQTGKWEKTKDKVGGTYVFTRKDKEGKAKDEVEALIKPNGDLVIVRVSNISAETLGKLFELNKRDEGKETSERLVEQKWLYDYGKFNLIYGENTRQACLKKSLLSDPVGSLEGEMKDPLRRFQEADMSGDFMANSGWRYAETEDKKSALYEITRDDWAEMYLDAVIKISKNRKSGKFANNLNYIVGGENLRSYLIGDARQKAYLTPEAEERLVKDHFGSDWERWLKRKIDGMGIVFALRYPGMKWMMVKETMNSFWEAFVAYVFEGTGMESIFGGSKPKPRRQ